MMPVMGMQQGGGVVRGPRRWELGAMWQNRAHGRVTTVWFSSLMCLGISLICDATGWRDTASCLSNLSVVLNATGILFAGAVFLFPVPQPVAGVFPVRRERRQWGG